MFVIKYLRCTRSGGFLRSTGFGLKVVGYPEMNQKVCLNLVKKDKLCVIALKKKK